MNDLTNEEKEFIKRLIYNEGWTYPKEMELQVSIISKLEEN